jgi:hypothetical protein
VKDTALADQVAVEVAKRLGDEHPHTPVGQFDELERLDPRPVLVELTPPVDEGLGERVQPRPLERIRPVDIGVQEVAEALDLAGVEVRVHPQQRLLAVHPPPPR